jgi:hypothetical protein
MTTISLTPAAEMDFRTTLEFGRTFELAALDHESLVFNFSHRWKILVALDAQRERQRRGNPVGASTSTSFTAPPSSYRPFGRGDSTQNQCPQADLAAWAAYFAPLPPMFLDHTDLFRYYEHHANDHEGGGGRDLDRQTRDIYAMQRSERQSSQEKSKKNDRKNSGRHQLSDSSTKRNAKAQRARNNHRSAASHEMKTR